MALVSLREGLGPACQDLALLTRRKADADGLLQSASLRPPIRSLVSSRPRSLACLFCSSLAGMKLAQIISSNAAVPCTPYCNDKNTQCSFSATYAAGCCDCTGQKRGVKRSVEESARACGRVWLHCAASLSLEACCQKKSFRSTATKKVVRLGQVEESLLSGSQERTVRTS